HALSSIICCSIHLPHPRSALFPYNDALPIWLNRVVDKIVNQNMFVTMFYGLSEELNHLLYCSSAGHEPGYVYRAETEEFEEISVRGRVLGVSQQTRY